MEGSYSSRNVHKNSGPLSAPSRPKEKPVKLRLSLLSFVALVLVLVASSEAKDKDLPEAPSAVIASAAMASPIMAGYVSTSTLVHPIQAETRVVDTKFISLAVISTGSTFADSYTTLFARQNWLAGKKGVCNVEVESAYLYGTHPTVGRAYAVASVKSVSSALAAYYLRKHHSKLWSAPLFANSIISLQGVTQNMVTCN
jgi:hypothetical protein